VLAILTDEHALVSPYFVALGKLRPRPIDLDNDVDIVARSHPLHLAQVTDGQGVELHVVLGGHVHKYRPRPGIGGLRTGNAFGVLIFFGQAVLLTLVGAFVDLA